MVETMTELKLFAKLVTRESIPVMRVSSVPCRLPIDPRSVDLREPTVLFRELYCVILGYNSSACDCVKLGELPIFNFTK